MATTTTTNAVIREAYIKLTSAQVLALTTGYTLVPAPGANKIIVPIGQAYIGLNFNSVAYTGAATTRIGFSGATSAWFTIGSTFLNSGSSQKNYIDQITTSAQQMVANTALSVFGTANPATGDSTLTIILNYAIIDEIT